jgi:hypothetical protein
MSVNFEPLHTAPAIVSQLQKKAKTGHLGQQICMAHILSFSFNALALDYG